MQALQASLMSNDIVNHILLKLVLILHVCGPACRVRGQILTAHMNQLRMKKVQHVFVFTLACSSIHARKL